MSELAKSYESADIESKWQELWDKNKTFAVTNPLEADFAIALPPPNVTGELHMGHALNDTLQDILIRFNRMQGKKVHWQIGCDHAGIGTQIVVEKQLAKEGKSKYDLGRSEFEKRIWDWTKQHLGKIEKQMKKLGCSPDWDRSTFTLNPNYVQAVRKAFFELSREGLVYQGVRLINWCPHCLTSLSDLEVTHEDRNGKLYKIKYQLTDSIGEIDSLVVATSRPETLFGDVAVAINPQDERYQPLIDLINNGQEVSVQLPLAGRSIPVILSDAVKLDFGTGALKITPAHDFNDQDIAKEWNQKGKENKLEAINIFNEKAELLKLAFIPEALQGLERFKAREAVLKLLAEQELLEEEEKYSQAASLHDRCGTVIEPYLSKQWFIHMKPLAKVAIEALNPTSPNKQKVQFFPERYGKTYLDWLNNIQDWCISRQLWWGHQIPVWTKKVTTEDLSSTEAEALHVELMNELKNIVKELGYSLDIKGDRKRPSLITGTKLNNEYIFERTNESVQIVILSADEAFENKLQELGYQQSTDVLDTWFSSALWPFAAQGWPVIKAPKSSKPWTNVLITARDIINLWVSRMIFSALKLTDKLPFTDILIHPVIQTPDGKRMSKSKGNAIDPISLVEKYGADASRLWYCGVGIFANQDTRFPGKKEKDGSWTSPEIENKRRFINKLWNATKFVLQCTAELSTEEKNIINKKTSEIITGSNPADNWILSLWNKCIKEANTHLENYRFGEFSKTLENFVWDEFCDWYLELAKVGTNSGQETNSSKVVMFYILEQVLRALHPVLPFVTEELWQALTGNQEGLSKQSYPQTENLSSLDTQIGQSNQQITNIKTLIQDIRSIRQKTLGLAANAELQVYFTDTIIELTPSNWQEYLLGNINWTKIARVNQLEQISETKGNIPLYSRLSTDSENCLNIPFRIEVPETVDLNARKEIIQKDLSKRLIEMSALQNRYNNPGFLNNASEEAKEELQSNIARTNQEVKELEEALSQIASVTVSA